MKQVIFKRSDGFYMTSKQNYCSYIQNARAIKKLDGVNTINDVYQVIETFCRFYNDEPENYEIDFQTVLNYGG